MPLPKRLVQSSLRSEAFLVKDRTKWKLGSIVIINLLVDREFIGAEWYYFLSGAGSPSSSGSANRTTQTYNVSPNTGSRKGEDELVILLSDLIKEGVKPIALKNNRDKKAKSTSLFRLGFDNLKNTMHVLTELIDL